MFELVGCRVDTLSSNDKKRTMFDEFFNEEMETEEDKKVRPCRLCRSLIPHAPRRRWWRRGLSWLPGFSTALKQKHWTADSGL